MRRTLLVGAAALMLATAHAAQAQGALDCQTITNDVTVTDSRAPMPQTPDGTGIGDRTSAQILARWATVQDRDPEACTTLKRVQQRLAAEAQAATAQCPDVASVVRQRIEVANGEMAVVCGR